MGASFYRSFGRLLANIDSVCRPRNDRPAPHGQPLLGQRRAQRVTAHPLQPIAVAGSNDKCGGSDG